MSAAPRRFGWIPDVPDQRDHLYAVPFIAELPPRVDLATGFAPVYDQGNLGSCTAQAIAAAIQFDQLKQALPDVSPSRLFIYYQERVLEGSVASDSGAMIRDGIKVCDEYGVAPEPLWPYDVARFAEPPPPATYEEALHHQILRYARVPQDARSLKSVLAEGFPIIFGFSVYESMMADAVQRSGDVPMPGWLFDRLLGGHAVVLVGYDDAPARFRFRNSWGTGWGDHGHGTLPYDYVTSARLADDFWVIRLTE